MVPSSNGTVIMNIGIYSVLNLMFDCPFLGCVGDGTKHVKVKIKIQNWVRKLMFFTKHSLKGI